MKSQAAPTALWQGRAAAFTYYMLIPTSYVKDVYTFTE